MGKSIEEITINAKNRDKTGVYGDIYQGLVIKEIPYYFERKELIQDVVSVMLPIVFEEMDEKIKKLKYPAEGRPQYIKTSADTTVNLCFSLLDQEITQQQIPYLRDQMRTMLMKVQPANIFFDNKVEQREDQTFAWFSYKAYTVDVPIYTHMFITNIDEKVLHGTFVCMYSDMELWKSAFKDIMLSVVDMKKENNHENSKGLY